MSSDGSPYRMLVIGAVAAARARLEPALGYLRDESITVSGSVGDADPLMLSTHPPGRSHWLENGLVDRVRAEVGIPVEHIVSMYGATLV